MEEDLCASLMMTTAWRHKASLEERGQSNNLLTSHIPLLVLNKGKEQTLCV